MKKGIELVMAASGIEEDLTDADLLITGEGKIDHQSAEGKVVGGVTALASKYKIPCIAFCGALDLDEKGVKDLGLTRAFPILDGSVSAGEGMKNAATLLEQRAAMACELLME
jgi:glycerate kinase